MRYKKKLEAGERKLTDQDLEENINMPIVSRKRIMKKAKSLYDE